MFSSLPLKRQSIYILSQIAQAGRMECSGGQLVDTCTVYSTVIVQTHATMKTQMENWPDFSLTITFFYLFFNDFSDIKTLLALSLHGAVFI